MVSSNNFNLKSPYSLGNGISSSSSTNLSFLRLYSINSAIEINFKSWQGVLAGMIEMAN